MIPTTSKYLRPLSLALLALSSCAPAQRPGPPPEGQAEAVALPSASLQVQSELAQFKPAGPWRSALYPAGWAPARPDARGRFLHDFSYAGYARGEKPIPDDPPGRRISALEFGADPSGARNSTRAIQDALDAAGVAGGVVLLPAGTFRIEVPPNARQALWLRRARVVLRGAGRGRTFLFCSSTDLRGKSVLRVAPSGSGSWTRPLPNTTSPITRDISLPTMRISVVEADKFRVGEWVVVRSDASTAFIQEHGMSGWWEPGRLDGPMLYRKILKVDRAVGTLTLDAPTRYPMKVRDGARVYKVAPALSEVGVEDLSIGNAQSLKEGWGDEDFSRAGTGAHEAHGSHLIELSHVLNGWVRRVSSYAPPGNAGGFHMISNGLKVARSRGVTVRDCDFSRPQYRGGGGNGYGFNVGGNDVLWQGLSSSGARHAYSFKGMSTSGNVLLRCSSERPRLPTDFHMHLSMANLIDNFTADADFIESRPRPYGSPGARHGHTSSQSVIWNTRGLSYHPKKRAVVESQQWGWGYVIGTRGPASAVSTAPSGEPSEPEDWAEGVGRGDDLRPASLYEDQLRRRLRRR